MQDNNTHKEQLVKTFGEIVRAHRKAKGKSMYAISAESGLSKSTWREVEIGACKNINFTTMWQIADGLEFPLEELIKELKEKLGSDFNLMDE